MKTFVENRLHIRKKVLVVDDESINRMMLEKIISRTYDVILAENGRQALDIILMNRDTLSLVLLDLMMPEMDGYELLEIIRKDSTLSHIPVIVLTSELVAEVKSLNMGAADFIPKPYNVPEVIMARVGRTIQLYENISIITATQFDDLTELFNKEYFMEYVTVYDHYYPDVMMDALVFDINRFHVINELHGRSFGNDVLCRIAALIKEYVNTNRGIACRYHADRFFVYLPHLEDPEDIYRYLEKGAGELLEDVRARLRLGIYPNADRSLEVNRRFDRALFAANSIRGNLNSQIAVYDAKMHEKETFDENLIREMEKGLEEKQFELYFQPKFDITGESPVMDSAEALVRWNHPKYGLVSPESFIPLFEANGLINKLDRFVWNEVSVRIRDWKRRYGTAMPVSVNVSRIDMLEPDFVQVITGIVRDHGLHSGDIHLEITESAYTENSDDIIEVVDRLRDLGFKVEMDDFGSGYSSLNMLSCLPIDALKLDKKFIDNIQKNPKDMRMVTLVMDIAEYLGVTVVAEGVETKEQYDLLKEAGCHMIQGFYFSKPVPADRFEALVAEKIEKELNEEIDKKGE